MAARLTPSLFDKLVSDLEIDGMRDDASTGLEAAGQPARVYTVARLERFNEQAMRATVMRDLNWLLNTTHLGADVDLEPYPEVQRSVVNFGVPDLTGRTTHQRLVQSRARQIRDAIRTFEPRLNPQRLDIEASTDPDKANSLTYVIRSDIVSAVQSMPVQFMTDIEPDGGAATVRE